MVRRSYLVIDEAHHGLGPIECRIDLELRGMHVMDVSRVLD